MTEVYNNSIVSVPLIIVTGNHLLDLYIAGKGH